MGDVDRVSVVDQDFADAFAALGHAIGRFKELNDNPDYRCRALSLAITELETGELWANVAFGECIDKANEAK